MEASGVSETVMHQREGLLVTLGYGRKGEPGALPSVERLGEILTDLDAVLVDTRENPGPKTRADTQRVAGGSGVRWADGRIIYVRGDMLSVVLSEQLGPRYEWRGDVLGGIHGSSAGPTPEGIARLAEEYRQGRRIVLLCACGTSPLWCHRHQLIAAPLGRIAAPERPEPPNDETTEQRKEREYQAQMDLRRAELIDAARRMRLPRVPVGHILLEPEAVVVRAAVMEALANDPWTEAVTPLDELIDRVREENGTREPQPPGLEEESGGLVGSTLPGSRRLVLTVSQDNVPSVSAVSAIVTGVAAIALVDMRAKPATRGRWTPAALAATFGANVYVRPPGTDPAPTIRALPDGPVVVLEREVHSGPDAPWRKLGREADLDVRHLWYKADAGDYQVIKGPEMEASLIEVRNYDFDWLSDLGNQAPST